MNRFKFRAWDGEKMVNPDYITRDGIAVWQENGCFEHSKNVMQFTGLKDKNGVEIYDGDIVNHYVEHEFLDKSDWEIIQGEVKQIGGCWVVSHKAYSLYSFKNEVIGNIYENKELIK